MIHNWFLRNGRLDEDFNCNTPPLVIDKDLAKKFLSELAIVNNDHGKAEELFPTASGFFWGSTLYDEWYYDDLKNTYNVLIKEYNNTDWKNEHWEYSCWW